MEKGEGLLEVGVGVGGKKSSEGKLYFFFSFHFIEPITGRVLEPTLFVSNGSTSKLKLYG